jgi:hypothetical protein
MIEQKDAPSPLPGNGGAKHPRRTRADDDCVEWAGGRHGGALAAQRQITKRAPLYEGRALRFT